MRTEKWTGKKYSAYRVLSEAFDVLTDIIKSLGYIVVYPVLDESQWIDKNGNVLPDAYLMKDGDTALDLAYKIHTDIGKKLYPGNEWPYPESNRKMY